MIDLSIFEYGKLRRSERGIFSRELYPLVMHILFEMRDEGDVEIKNVLLPRVKEIIGFPFSAPDLENRSGQNKSKIFDKIEHIVVDCGFAELLVRTGRGKVRITKLGERVYKKSKGHFISHDIVKSYCNDRLSRDENDKKNSIIMERKIVGNARVIDSKEDNHCFVIQPFDKKFNSRYDSSFKPALEAAGILPYRTDEDPSVNDILKTIEDKIKSSKFCLADISTDNPNVWYEVGFAFACGKEVILLCSDERESEKLPFDISHRNVTNYKINSKDDWHSLEEKITERAKAIMNKIS